MAGPKLGPLSRRENNGFVHQAYILYALRLLADGEIPGLGPSVSVPEYDVRIWLNNMPAGLGSRQRALWYEGNSLNIWRIVPEGDFHFVYTDGTEFLIQADGKQIRCSWPEQATVTDTAVYLRGPVLGMVLRLHGVVCLHASAVAVHGSAIAVMGDSGAGKSTAAAGFVKLGFPVLADDVAALRQEAGRFQVLPGYPQLNLWPDAAEALYGSDSLPRIMPSDGINDWWDKRYLALDIDRQFHRNPLPLAAVYVLGARVSDEDAPRIEPLPAKDALIELTGLTYVNYALDKAMRVLEFETLSQLVRTVPVRLVTPHSNPARVMDLCEMILRDHETLPPLTSRSAPVPI